jgi:hypothetical protein
MKIGDSETQVVGEMASIISSALNNARICGASRNEIARTLELVLRNYGYQARVMPGMGA